MKHKTYKQRTLELETVRFALGHGYIHTAGNLFALKHFSFICFSIGAPAIEVNWFKGTDYPSIKVGNTSVHGDGADQRALELLKRFWRALTIPLDIV